MTRRTFLAGLSAALLSCQPAFGHGFPAEARDPLRVPERQARGDDNAWKYWAKLLAAHGFVDGREIEITVASRARARRSTPLRSGWRLPTSIVAKRPDAIIAHMTWIEPLRRATSQVPVVFIGALDLAVHAGFDSLRRPGGNITGVYVPFFEMHTKRLEWLKAMHPGPREPRWCTKTAAGP
jgi:hypothetical protein